MDWEDEFLNVHQSPTEFRNERFNNASSNWFRSIRRNSTSFPYEFHDETSLDLALVMNSTESGIGSPPALALMNSTESDIGSPPVLALNAPLQRRHLSQVRSRIQQMEIHNPEGDPTRLTEIVAPIRRHSETDLEDEFRQIHEDEELARILQAQFDGELDDSGPINGSRYETSFQRTPGRSQPFQVAVHNDSSSSSGSDIFEEMWYQPRTRISERNVPSITTRSATNSRLNREAASSRFSFRRARVSRRANSQSSVDEYERLWDLTERLGDVVPRGLPEAQLSRLPVRMVSKDGGGDPSCSGAFQRTTKDDNDCLICLAEFQKNDTLRILPCFHEYHMDCIDKWFQDNNTCPICRVRVDID